MVGTILRSKITGDLFHIDDEYTENGKELLVVRHANSGKICHKEKGWFLHGLMMNLEVVEPPQKRA